MNLTSLNPPAKSAFSERNITGVDGNRIINFGCTDDRGYLQIAAGRREAGPMHTISSARRIVLQIAIRLLSVDGLRFYCSSSRQARCIRRAISRGLRYRVFLYHEVPPPLFDNEQGWLYSTGWPLSARIFFTVPDLSLSIWFRSFIASM